MLPDSVEWVRRIRHPGSRGQVPFSPRALVSQIPGEHSDSGGSGGDPILVDFRDGGLVTDSVLVELHGSGSDRGIRGFSHSFLLLDCNHGSFVSCCFGLGSGISNESYCSNGSGFLCYEGSCSRVGSTYLGIVSRYVGSADSDDGVRQ